MGGKKKKSKSKVRKAIRISIFQELDKLLPAKHPALAS